MGRPTEEDLGIEMTPGEQAILDAPITTAPEEDDIRPSDDDDDTLIAAKPKPERTKDPVTGKFVPKDAAPADGSRPDVVNRDAAPTAAPPPGFVDVRAMQEARAENRLLQERMNTLLETLNKREARAAKAEEPPPPAKPDLAVDPETFIRSLAERVDRFENETAAQTRAREAQEAEQRSYNEAVAVARPQFEQAVAAEPLLGPQYNELLQSYAREIVALNEDTDEFKRDPRGFLSKAMTKLEGDHIRYATHNNIPLGSYIKRLALSRGIDANYIQARINAGQGGQQQGGQQQRPIAERQAAATRHQSLGDMPGGPAPTAINAKDLVKMSPKEFAAFAKKMGDEGLDQLFMKA